MNELKVYKARYINDYYPLGEEKWIMQLFYGISLYSIFDDDENDNFLIGIYVKGLFLDVYEQIDMRWMT